MTKCFCVKFEIITLYYNDYTFLPGVTLCQNEAQLRIIFPQSFKGGRWSQSKKLTPPLRIT